MAKKAALLVRTEFVTRVVVDVPDDFDTETKNDVFYGRLGGYVIPENSELEESLLNKAEEKLLKTINVEHIGVNIVEVVNDTEQPYDPTFDKDK